jgi:hypothetical protein
LKPCIHLLRPYFPHKVCGAMLCWGCVSMVALKVPALAGTGQNINKGLDSLTVSSVDDGCACCRAETGHGKQ